MEFLNNASILITGGTGTLGKSLVRRLLSSDYNIKRLVVFSRDEQKQFQMAQEFPNKDFPQLRYFIGDIRDEQRIRQALANVDHVIHTAAMKHIPIAEYNPMECIKTNIIGSQNVINACIDCGIKRVVALSTDKAAAPVNLYGATKLAADKLFVAANNYVGGHDIRFSVVRYGNVMGSNGSVIPFFQKRSQSGTIPITHPKMTRFNITVNQAVDIVLYAMEYADGGEIFVPKLPSYRILELAQAIAPDCKTEVIGIREGEKIHEEMITPADAMNTYDIGKYYVIFPYHINMDEQKVSLMHRAKKVPENFSYNSGNNEHFLEPKEISKLLEELDIEND